MERRTFLRNSSISVGAITLPALGCASNSDKKKGKKKGASRYTAEPVSSSYRVGTAHLTFGPDGSVYRIDPHAHGVHAVDDGGQATASIASFGDDSGKVNFPIDASVSNDGHVWVVDHGNARIVAFDAKGRAVAEVTDVSRPRGLIISRSGEVLVCDAGSHEVDVLTASGERLRSFTDSRERELFTPIAIAEDSTGNLHVVDSGQCRIVVFSPEGEVLKSYGEHGGGEGEFIHPRAIAITPNDLVCVGEAGTGLITVFDLDGNVVERFPVLNEEGEPVSPLELTIDPDGRLYVWAPEIHGPDPYIEA